MGSESKGGGGTLCSALRMVPDVFMLALDIYILFYTLDQLHVYYINLSTLLLYNFKQIGHSFIQS